MCVFHAWKMTCWQDSRPFRSSGTLAATTMAESKPNWRRSNCFVRRENLTNCTATQRLFKLIVETLLTNVFRPVRHNEDVLNEELADSLGMTDRLFSFDDPHVKAQLLLHARLRGARLPIADYTTDTRSVLENCSRVLAALVDVAANAGALRTTLALCRLSQALGSSCSFAKDELCQLGVDEETARNLRSSLGLSREQGVRDAIRRRRFKQVAGSSAVKSSEAMRSETSLEATLENPDSPGNSVEGNKVQCDATCALRVQSKIVGGNGSRRTTRNNEGWWLVLAEDDDLLALKRVSMRGGGGRGHASLDTKLIFAAPENTGPASLRLYALADNCRGFDATLDIHLDVV